MSQRGFQPSTAQAALETPARSHNHGLSEFFSTLLGINYARMGRRKEGYLSFLICLIATVLLFLVLIQIPEEIMDRIPNVLIPTFYGVLCWSIVERLQGREIRLVLEASGKKASVWRTAGWGLLSMVLALAGIFGYAFSLPPHDLYEFEGEKYTFGLENIHSIYYSEGIDKERLAQLSAYFMEVGLASEDSPLVIEVSRKQEEVYITLPFHRDFWDHAAVLEDLKRMRDEIVSNGIFEDFTFFLYAEDFGGTYRKKI